ncbi:uncharacterized protein LOC131294805 [Anopheles ziemanni]|uniref:uncharacterized protein LOC131265377 n=1 Tax=Anopheles coustani TaxID=139045 RepID=UPI002659810F|nr:uncharacterized protein LOC131265377 [Anopheles coustani]XP_058178833.1 uncharacterized protein LOC131294805 [Anopheles ziemanni]
MKCSSCIGGGRRSLSSSDHESASPVTDGLTTADREYLASHTMAASGSERRDLLGASYRVDSPSANNGPEDSGATLREHDTDDYRPPSITIEELDDDQEESVLMDPQTVGYAHLLLPPSLRAPLEVIREEELSDCSDSEFSHRPPTTTDVDSTVKRDDPPPTDMPDGGGTARGDAVAHGLAKFSPAKVLREILRYRRRRHSGSNRKHPSAPFLHRQEQRQEQTTCVLVGAKEADIAPQEYRSVCTTETVNCEMLEVEVINIGSNSSSLDDLSDVEHADTVVEQVDEEQVYEKLELEDEHTTTTSVHENRGEQQTPSVSDDPTADEQLDDHPSKQSPSESITTQIIPDSQDVEIHPTSYEGVASSDPPLRLDNTHNSSPAGDRDLHQTEKNDDENAGPKSVVLQVVQAGFDGSSSSSDGIQQFVAPAHPATSSSVTDDTTGDALLDISSSSGVVPVDRDRDRASVVGVDDDESVQTKASLNPSSSSSPSPSPPSEIDRATLIGVGSRVNHCVQNGKGPPLPPLRTATIMSIEADDESVSAVTVVKKGHRPPPPLPPVPAPRVAAIPLPPPPSVDEEATTSGSSVTHSGRSQPPVGDAGEGKDQEEKSVGSVAPPPPPLPSAYLVPLTVEALSVGASSPQNGQIHSGDHSSQTDHADADQNSAQDSVDAVAAADPSSPATAEAVHTEEFKDDQSVLLKYMQEDSVSGSSNRSETIKSSDGGDIFEDFKQRQRTTGQPTDSYSSDPGESKEGHGPKIEPSSGSRRRGGQYLCDGFEPAVVRRPRQVSRSNDPVPADTTAAVAATAGMGVIPGPVEPNRLANTKGSSGGNQDSSSPEHKAALVADLRTEISRLKDAELQEEFLKLELETAKYERELQLITVPKRDPKVANGVGGSGSAHDNRTYFVSKQQDFVVERSPNNGAPFGSSRMTGGGRQRGHVPAPPPVADAKGGTAENEQLYNEWQQKMEQREERRVQRIITTEQSFSQQQQQQDAVSGAIQAPGGPTPPPPPPPTTDADEEIFTKKVKDRVRDLMASQAAAAEEARARQRGRVVSSAPSTPTARRKHIEEEFREFREIRQRETAVVSAALAAESAKENARQLVEAVNHYAPSKIPLATSYKKVPGLQRPTPAAPAPKGTAVTINSNDQTITSSINEAQSAGEEEIKVNVAALIATHQEKQQLQQVVPVASGQPPKVAPSRSNTDGRPTEQLPIQDECTSEPTVSVSDKCQQFEQRIRRNSETGKVIDSSIAPTVSRKPTTSASGHQQPQGRAGTTIGSYGDSVECCDTKRRGFCSEADLLHEIDHALVLAKDFLFSRGVWSPFNRSTEILTKEELAERSTASAKGRSTEIQQPVWTPRSAPPSPASERREFRPIGFESPTPTRRVTTPSPATTSATVAAPWTQPGYNPPLTVPKAAPLQTSASNPTIGGGTPHRSTTTTAPTPPPPVGQQYQVRFAPQPRSNSQEPTINSLLKSKDGKTASVGVAESGERLQKGASTTLSTSANRSASSSTTTTSTTTTTYQQQGNSIDQPDSGLEATQHQHKMQQMAHQKVDGIGPITREGMPLTLRSEVDEGNRDKWYKQMYHTLHKAHDDDDYVTVRYKTRRGYPYKSSGYQSEPEPNYDSDYTIKYSTLDRRRTPLDLSPASYSKFNTLQSNPSPPQHFHQPTAKSGLTSYRNQPGRIENYTPGRSSISDKESKEWWDEVMDIFNGQLEHQKLTTSKTYTEGNLSRALKEQGYESDSTLVFRKREPPASAALSPVEQKQYYKTMQAGGEIPLQGFRKPAPEKPKDRAEESFDVKVEISEESSTNPFLPRGGGGGGEGITCYPITSISRPLDMFGPFPKETRTFVPPVPPSRKSSRSNSTLKIMSQVKTNTYDRRTVLERTTSHGQSPKFRSKSAGPTPFFVTSTSMMKEEKNQENSTRMASKRFASYRVSSTSPTGGGGGGGGSQGHQRKASPSPVAFGRGISKERTFAEEKKRIEEKLPKVVSVSTSILRNPELKSPNEVKKALRSSYLPIVGSPGTTMERSTLRRFPSNATFRSASSVYSSSKSLNSRVMSPATPGGHRKEEKPYKVTIASSKGSSVSPKDHQGLMKKSHTRKPSHADRRPTVTIKSSFQKASKAFGLKTKTPSTQSLARTSSTYSIDSTNSNKRKSRICYIPITTEKNVANRAPPRQRMFAGSLDRGLKSLRRISGSPATVQEECYSERIVRQQAAGTGNVRTDTFFQNLFLKGSSAPGPAETSDQGSVLQKARQWNSLSCRSEPTLKQPNYYLSQARPVTSSKFKSLDRREGSHQHTPMVRSFECRPGGEVVEQVNRFESLVKLTDEDEYDDEGHQQFGYVRGRRMKIDYSFHERSRSEPTTTTTMTTKSTVIQEELISTNSPRTIVGRRCEVTQQRTSRSPSCRRIQYLKGKEGQVKRIIRARSLSSHKADQRPPRDALVRSHSLNLNHEPVVSRNRFRDLNTFYNSLERLGQLERVTSSSSAGDLRPVRRTRDEEIIDFDLWKRVRDHEKAERELNQLKHRLKLDQREKDLFFLPRDPDEVRWRSDLDTGLRNREKSVDDLKCLLSQQTLHFEDVKLRELEVRKDHYKPLWRGSSVIDVASQLEEKYSSESASEKRTNEPQSLDIISSNLLSTLSSEQMRKLKSQLSEIYSGSSTGQKKQPAVTQQRVVAHEEEYIINVPERVSRLESLLKVRSNSVLTSDQVNPAQLRCQMKKPDLNADGGKKATVVASLQKTFEERSSVVQGKELDRATLSRTLCQELKDKILEKHHTLPSVGKKKRDARPSILPAATSAVEDRRFLSLESGMKKLEREPPASEKKKVEKEVRKERPHSYCDTESISSETSNKTVIFRSGQLQEQSGEAVVAAEDIRSKIKYFEERHTTDDTPTVTIYHARDDSSPSEDEVQQDESRKEGPRHGSSVTLSQSFTDLKDLFGEKRSVSCSVYSAGPPPRSVSPKHFTFRSRSSTPDYATCIQTGEVRKIKDKFESLDGSMLRPVGTYRDDTPMNTSGGDRQYQSDSELNRFGESEQSKTTGGTIVRGHEAGDVSRMTHKYEVQAAGRRKSRKDRVTSPIPKNPFRKDDRYMPHINVISKTASLKQEIKPTRVPASKTVLLQSTQLQDVGPERQKKNQSRRSASSGSEEFEKLKSKFETGSGAAGGGGGGGGSEANLSLLGKMYTSVPDVRELKDIPGYLSGSWIAHQFPKPTDNARSLTAPEQSPPGKQIVRKGSRPASPNQHHTHQQHHQHHPSLRSHSSSPPRQPRDAKTHSRSSSDATASFLRQFYSNGHVDGDDDDEMLLKQKQARTKGERFVSNQQLEAEALWRKIQLMTSSRSTNNDIGLGDTAAGKPTVTFEESPRRYIESDVNIHYKTPIRFEYKEPIPDDELAYRQAEHMRRVYQEERRRKYINELEDMHSRRHTDNIPPSQKSPIPLNRYDDFAADLSPKPQHVLKQPKTIARALYNFQGQSIRELSFRKGDIIHLRRQIDKNWYEGEHNANVGLLPANYIEILNRDNVNVKPLPKKPVREGKARAKFNFTAQTGVELSLLKGELVTLTRRVDDNWFEGKIGSKKGIFPVSYVEILTDINGEESYDIEPIVHRPQSAHGVTSQPTHTLTTHYGASHTNGRVSPGILRETKTVQKTEVLHVDTSNEPISYRALYNYKPQNSDELELLEGDVVYVLEKCDDGWYVGTSARTGCFGTFPGNYVSKM